MERNKLIELISKNIALTGNHVLSIEAHLFDASSRATTYTTGWSSTHGYKADGAGTVTIFGYVKVNDDLESDSCIKLRVGDTTGKLGGELKNILYESDDAILAAIVAESDKPIGFKVTVDVELHHASPFVINRKFDFTNVEIYDL